MTKIIDPMTKKESLLAGDYNPNEKDNVHSCGDARPSASVTITDSGAGEDGSQSWKVTGTATFGTFELSSYTLIVDGQTVKSGGLNPSSDTVEYTTTTKPTSVSFKIEDKAGYVYTATGAN